MNKELKEHIKFCYITTYNTYKGIFSIEKIKRIAFESIKKHLEFEEKQGLGYGKITDEELFTFIKKL